MYGPPPGSPPGAYPPALPHPGSRPGLAGPPPPPIRHSPRAQLGSASTYYLTGSAAPSIVAHRRPDYAPPPQPRPPPLPPQQQLHETEAASCQCCATAVRYPRGSTSFRCMSCGVICDFLKPKGLAAAWGGDRGVSPSPSAEPTPVSLDELHELQRAFASSAELSSQLSGLSISSTAPTNPFALCTSVSEAEDALQAVILRAFSSLPSLSRSFLSARPSPSPPPPTPTFRALPQYHDLETFYDLVISHPAALATLRQEVERLLERPGKELWDESEGVGWAVALLECPIWFARYTPEYERRHRLISRFLGLLSNLSNALHHQLVTSYLSRSESTSTSTPSYSREALQSKVELVVSFISSRIGASLSTDSPSYTDDWCLRVAAKVGALLFAANLAQPRLPMSTFYCTIVDSLGETAMVDGFLRWEARDGRFTLCQYPFLLSLGVKIHLLNYDGQRQMRDKAREAYHSTVFRRQLEMPFLHITVRRAHLVQDSLQQISQSRAHLKKGLKITFEGEDGIDAGGLRKEWFLLLCRQLFDPQWGMFIHDSDSNLCWFNPVSQDLDEFYLVGVVVGLACYNAATLDVPLPQAVYKKLLNEPVSLIDLAVFRPSLARGLRQLLDYEETEAGGSVENVFCRTFVGEVEEWGEVKEVELVPGGADQNVTRENREDFVRLYVAFQLSTSISSQFEAFSAGFTQVTSGNSLSLFKGEELELLVRGSDEQLDVEQLKGVTEYKGWDPEDETVLLFWHVFTTFSPASQRLLLSFITGSDRIPATGSSALTLKLTNMGPDTGRWPTSHTCFNEICLYRYRGEERMKEMLEGAMRESEGFGLK